MDIKETTLERLTRLYNEGRVNDEGMKKFVPTLITPEQYAETCGIAYVA